MMKNEVNEVVDKYAKMLYRIAYINLKSKSDAEDIVQDVFLKYLLNKKPFADENHRRNWLIRITLNLCSNLRKSAWKRKVVHLDVDSLIDFETEEQNRIFYDLDFLPEKYKVVVQLHYFEDLSIETISNILGISESNVKVRLFRAREMLREDYKKGEISYGKI